MSRLHRSCLPAALLATALLTASCGATHKPAVVPPPEPGPSAEPAQEQAIRDQCLPDTEQSWFDCATTDGAWLSVCGPAGPGATPTWLQLRLGPPMAADVMAPATMDGPQGAGWEEFVVAGAVARAMHLGDGAAVFTVLPDEPEGEARAGAVLPDGRTVACRSTTVEDSLPDLAPGLSGPAAPLATTGTLSSLQNGDVACYIALDGPLGELSWYGDFELCQTATELVGRSVVVQIGDGRVIAPSCQGDPECPDHIDVQIVTEIRPAD